MKHPMVIGIVLMALLILTGVAAYFGRPAPAAKQRYGLTYTAQQARDLGLDPRESYLRLLDDGGAKRLRLGAYWNLIQPRQRRYEFAELDWQLDEAAAHQATVVLAIGRKLPRWPECFEPGWVKGSPKDIYDEAVLAMLRTVIARYDNHPAVVMWQLENEPFVGWFGDCAAPDPALLARERELLKSLSSKPVVTTDSGELSTWRRAAHFVDFFGTTMYRVTWNPYFGYGRFPWPAWFYRMKARLLGLDPQDVLITELQAEPWTPGIPLAETSIDEQLKSMNMKQFEENIALAKRTGFGDVYLWGAEWWLWMEDHGHPEFLEAAKKLMSK